MTITIDGQPYDGGYPYLNIARHYDLDYGTVLSYADAYNSAPQWNVCEILAIRKIESHSRYVDIYTDIQSAVRDFLVKRGECGP